MQLLGFALKCLHDHKNLSAIKLVTVSLAKKQSITFLWSILEGEQINEG